jgi:CBS domain-containing protein
MASNPKWCQPLRVWKGYFDHWINAPEPKEVMHATIFFDFRPVMALRIWGMNTHEYLMGAVKGQEVFLRFLAKDCLSTPSATGLFKRFVLEREGEHKDKLDIKSKGLVPFVDFARLLSLRYQVPAANTLERLQAVAEGGHISNDLYQKAHQAYEIQMDLRLVHQDQQWAGGLEPDNFLDPEQLSELERKNLKDALGVVGEIKSYLKDQFHLNAG